MCIRHVMMMGVYGGVHLSVRPTIFEKRTSRPLPRRLRRSRIHPFVHSSVASHRVASSRPLVVVFGGLGRSSPRSCRRRAETRRRHDARDGRDGG